MSTTPKFDTMSAVKIIETTPFDSAENRAGREYLRARMDDEARDAFDDAVTALRSSLAPMSPEDRAAYRGFQCEITHVAGNEVKFDVSLLSPAEIRPTA